MGSGGASPASEMGENERRPQPVARDPAQSKNEFGVLHNHSEGKTLPSRSARTLSKKASNFLRFSILRAITNKASTILLPSSVV